MSVFLPPRIRALDVWRSIQGNPTTVTFTKPKIVTKTGTTPEVVLPSQTVRISKTANANLVEGVAGIVPKWQVIIFGVRDHPTQPNTDMQEGYTAMIDGDNYRVVEVIFEPGEIRARVEVIG